MALGLNRWFVNACQERGVDVLVCDPRKLDLKKLNRFHEKASLHLGKTFQKLPMLRDKRGELLSRIEENVIIDPVFRIEFELLPDLRNLPGAHVSVVATEPDLTAMVTSIDVEAVAAPRLLESAIVPRQYAFEIVPLQRWSLELDAPKSLIEPLCDCHDLRISFGFAIGTEAGNKLVCGESEEEVEQLIIFRVESPAVLIEHYEERHDTSALVPVVEWVIVYH